MTDQINKCHYIDFGPGLRRYRKMRFIPVSIDGRFGGCPIHEARETFVSGIPGTRLSESGPSFLGFQNNCLGWVFHGDSIPVLLFSVQFPLGLEGGGTQSGREHHKVSMFAVALVEWPFYCDAAICRNLQPPRGFLAIHQTTNNGRPKRMVRIARWRNRWVVMVYIISEHGTEHRAAAALKLGQGRWSLANAHPPHSGTVSGFRDLGRRRVC